MRLLTFAQAHRRKPGRPWKVSMRQRAFAPGTVPALLAASGRTLTRAQPAGAQTAMVQQTVRPQALAALDGGSDTRDLMLTPHAFPQWLRWTWAPRSASPGS